MLARYYLQYLNLPRTASVEESETVDVKLGCLANPVLSSKRHKRNRNGMNKVVSPAFPSSEISDNGNSWEDVLLYFIVEEWHEAYCSYRVQCSWRDGVEYIPESGYNSLLL